MYSPPSTEDLRGKVGQRLLSKLPGLYGTLDAVLEDGTLVVSGPIGCGHFSPSAFSALAAPGGAAAPAAEASATTAASGSEVPTLEVPQLAASEEGAAPVAAEEASASQVAEAPQQAASEEGAAPVEAPQQAASAEGAAPEAAEEASAIDASEQFHQDTLKKVASVEELRRNGNDALSQNDYDGAIAAYTRANTDLLEFARAAGGRLSDIPNMAETFKDLLTKGHGNLAMTLLKKGDPASLKDAVAAAQTALNIDRENKSNIKDKVLWRKASAHKGLNQLEEARDCLQQMDVKDGADYKKLDKELKDLAKEMEKAERKAWSHISSSKGGSSSSSVGGSGSPRSPMAGGGAASSPRRDLQQELLGAKKPFTSTGGSETVEEESDETEEATESNLMWYGVGAAALGALAVGAFMMLRRK